MQEAEAPSFDSSTIPISVTVRPIEPQGKPIGFASVNIGGVVIDDFKVVNGENGIFLGSPSKRRRKQQDGLSEHGPGNGP